MKHIVAWTMIFSIVFTSSAEVFGFSESGANVRFRFTENLYSASTWILSRGKTIPGRWEDDKISFNKMGVIADIKPTTLKIKDKTVDVIQMNPMANVKRRLQFKNVPAGSTLNFSYGIEKRSTSAEVYFVNLSISAGVHQLKHLRIPIAPGWKHHSIPLGVLSFWDRKSTIIIEMTTDTREKSLFYVYGEIVS